MWASNVHRFLFACPTPQTVHLFLNSTVCVVTGLKIGCYFPPPSFRPGSLSEISGGDAARTVGRGCQKTQGNLKVPERVTVSVRNDFEESQCVYEANLREKPQLWSCTSEYVTEHVAEILLGLINSLMETVEKVLTQRTSNTHDSAVVLSTVFPLCMEPWVMKLFLKEQFVWKPSNCTMTLTVCSM